MKRTLMKKLSDWKKKVDRKPLILKGVRQCGKTYLLKKFASEYFSSYHYINFEKNKKLFKIFEKDLEPNRIIKDISFYLEKKINIDEDLLIFDEIQECPNALTSLKYFQEDFPKLAICSAGFLLGISLGATSFPVGKVDVLTLYPMSFREFLMATSENNSLAILDEFKKTKYIPEIVHLHLLECLKYYFIVGGMPDIVSTYCRLKDDFFKAFEEVRKKQEVLGDTYFADMAKHSENVNAMHLNRLFKSIPSQLLKSLDGNSKKFKFKGVIPGISHYDRLVNAIDWLENIGLILKVHIVNYAKIPLRGYSKDNFFKLFLFDIGILGSMSGLQAKSIIDHDYGSYKGYFIENFVLQEFFSTCGTDLFCWSEKKAEIEFLKEEDEKIVPIEVKAGLSLQAKSLKVFSKKYDPKYSIIISSNPFKYEPLRKRYFIPLYMAENIFESGFFNF